MSKHSEKGVACKDYIFSRDISQLYNSAAVQDANEAIIVLFHVFMLESGFISKDVSKEDQYQCMPKDWNSNGIFKIKYEHFCCPSYTCYMTCVPLYNTVSVHGIICDIKCSETVNIKVNVNNHLNQKKDVSDVLKVFYNIEELSRYFKDGLCLPLLNLLHETTGKNRLFGIRGLVDDVKMYILQFLPVECVMSMSAVNKDFNNLANSPFLWKYLFERDFAKGGKPDIETASSKTSWKQIYMKEYMKKKRTSQFRSRPYVIPPPRLPQIFNIGPDFDTDLNIYFDPPFPELFSPLRNIFPMHPRFNPFPRF